MPDFPIVDSHVHLCDPSRFGYDWTKNAPSLKRTVLPADFTRAAGKVKVDRFVFVEVDVNFPQHLEEAEWVQGLAQTDKRLAGMVAALRDKLGLTVNVPAEPQLTTALGAAVLGLQRLQRLGAPAAA